jgi:medium-chain acyl-[acyl-carrier-protein] hydrolase
LLVDLTTAITPYLDRPFAFFGHSMGALISFALTCHLRETLNLSPAHLFLSAFRAAHLPNPNIKIAHLPVEVFKVVLRADGIAETILQNAELMEAMLPTLRADLALCDTYVYQAQVPLLCPVTVFGGLEDVRVGQNDLEAWRSHFQGPFRLQMFSGTHFFLHSAQDPLLAALSYDLECYTGLIKEQSHAR